MVYKLTRIIKVLFIFISLIITTACIGNPELVIEDLDNNNFPIDEAFLAVSRPVKKPTISADVYQYIKELVFPEISSMAYRDYGVNLDFGPIEFLQFQNFDHSVDEVNDYFVIDYYSWFRFTNSNAQKFSCAFIVDSMQQTIIVIIGLRKRNEIEGKPEYQMVIEYELSYDSLEF